MWFTMEPPSEMEATQHQVPALRSVFNLTGSYMTREYDRAVQCAVCT